MNLALRKGYAASFASTRAFWHQAMKRVAGTGAGFATTRASTPSATSAETTRSCGRSCSSGTQTARQTSSRTAIPSTTMTAVSRWRTRALFQRTDGTLDGQCWTASSRQDYFGGKAMKASGGRKCLIFNCDHRHGNYCCADCDRRSRCDNPCLNGPDRCGQVKEEKTGE